MGKANRNSSVELLRIFSIIGIVCMHSLAPIFTNTHFLLLSAAENSVFNIGVTCFILISGYFGIRFSIRKWFDLEIIAIFGGIIIMLKLCAGGGITLLDFLKNLFPVATKNYWFLSCYICLALLAPYLEKAIRALSRKEFLLLLSILIFLFYLLPTCFYYQIMEDSGKGLVNMITVYLIGRYLRAYPIKLTKKNWGLLWIVAFTFTFGLNMILSFLTGSVKFPFARDNSIFILIQAVAAFHVFANTTFTSKIINKFAGFVFPIYIYNTIVLGFLPVLSEENLAGLTIAGMAIKIIGTILLTIALCIVIELIKRLFFIPVYKWIFPIVEHILLWGKNQIEIILDQIISIEKEPKL